MFDIENWLPFLLAKSHQLTFGLMKSTVEQFELTPPQFATLAFLWKRDGLNQQELGNLMKVDRTTIGGIVERLEKLGLVKREGDPADRRSQVVLITPEGDSIREEILHELSKVKKAVSLRLTPEEQEQLRTLLKKLRTNNII